MARQKMYDRRESLAINRGNIFPIRVKSFSVDWNWFFSSLAQSVAALVGVIAAFLIARLANSQGEFARAAKQLLYQGNHFFVPTGPRELRFQFDSVNGPAQRLDWEWSELRAYGKRIN